MATYRRTRIVFCKLLRTLNCKKLINIRYYTIQPPEWMGGKSMLVKSGRHDFPEHSETFDERLAKLSKENGIENLEPPVNIGEEYSRKQDDTKKKRQELLSVSIKNHRNKDFEKAARLKQLKVPLEKVQEEWLNDYGPFQCRIMAEHYGIYRDLFGNSYFMPVVNLNVLYDLDKDYAIPVCRGNKIIPSEARYEPCVEFESDVNSLWTLVLTNPDGHLSEQNSEYIHWMIGNIPGNKCTDGEVLVDYLQPIPPKGTGFHRHVFVLFQQSQKIDLSKWKRGICRSLDERTFKISQFYEENKNHLVPKGLAFFQSEWDDSVRDVYHKILDMEEPVYEYAHRPPYHPPPKKYPHLQPFDRYFDRYRDKKDLAEEVMRTKLKMISPFRENPKPEKYPMIHHPNYYKPSWLKLREDIMHRRLEQYKDLP